MQRIAFLSRGHGFGHAARDLLLIEAMRSRVSEIEISIASSGTGLAYFSSRSVACTDLGISDDQDQTYDAARRVLRFLAEASTLNLVVADEVFAAPAICKGLRVDCLMLTDFFWSEVGSPEHDKVFWDAEAVMLLDFPEAHLIPPELDVPVHATGPLTKYFPISREEARRRLGLNSGSFVLVATLGSMHPGKLTDIRSMLRTLFIAWHDKADGDDTLLVLADQDYVAVTYPGASAEDTVRWVGLSNSPEVFYRAADLVVAYAGFATLSELARNEIPTVCFLASMETPDAKRARHLESLGLMRTASLVISPEHLWKLGKEAIEMDQTRANQAAVEWGEAENIADLVLSYLTSS